jgi:hypothetical protein
MYSAIVGFVGSETSINTTLFPYLAVHKTYLPGTTTSQTYAPSNIIVSLIYPITLGCDGILISIMLKQS